jgi:hypothetical protein
LQKICEGNLSRFDWNVCDEAETAMVDADDWHIKGSEVTGCAKHCPVSTHHDREAGLLSNLCKRCSRVLADAGVTSRICLD